MKLNISIIFAGVMLMTNTSCKMIQGLESDHVLNKAAGKVFDVDLKEKSFRFLKQDVPPGNEPWYNVKYTE